MNGMGWAGVILERDPFCIVCDEVLAVDGVWHAGDGVCRKPWILVELEDELMPWSRLGHDLYSSLWRNP